MLLCLNFVQILCWTDAEMKHTWLTVIVFIVFALALITSLAQATEIQTTNLTSFGYTAGTAGANVAFFGDHAGAGNSGSYNSFFGGFAGVQNTTGYDNSFFGNYAGTDTTGSYNTFFGSYAGQSNTVENGNSFIGAYSDGTVGISNATAIGYLSIVTRSNSLVLGSVNGQNGATAETNVGIGVTNPDRQLTVEGTQAAVGRLRRYYGTADAFTRTFAPTFLLERSRGTQASPANIWAGDYLGKVQFRGVVGSTAIEYGAMAFIATDTSQNGRFSFLDLDLSTERMVIPEYRQRRHQHDCATGTAPRSWKCAD